MLLIFLASSFKGSKIPSYWTHSKSSIYICWVDKICTSSYSDKSFPICRWILRQLVRRMINPYLNKNPKTLYQPKWCSEVSMSLYYLNCSNNRKHHLLTTEEVCFWIRREALQNKWWHKLHEFKLGFFAVEEDDLHQVTTLPNL